MASQAELGILLKARDEASSVLKDVGKVAAGLGLAFAAAAAVAVKAAADEQIGIKQLEQAIRDTGVAWQGTIDAGDAQVLAWEKMTAVAAEDIRPVFAFLIAQTGSLSEATRRMPIAFDLARGANIDLAMASKLLGKLTEENVNVFKRLGLTFKAGATELDVLTAVQAKFGGQSATYAATAVGQWEILLHEIHEFVVSVGDELLPKVTVGIGIVSEMFGVISGSAPEAGGKLREAVGGPMAVAIMGALAAVRDTAKLIFSGDFPALINRVIAFVGEAVPKINAQLLKWGHEFIAWVGPQIPILLGELFAMLGQALAWVREHKVEIQAELKKWGALFGEFVSEVAIPALTAALPGIVELLIAFALTVPGLIQDAFMAIGKSIGDAVGTAIRESWNGIAEAFRYMLTQAIQSVDFWVGPFHVSGRTGITFSLGTHQTFAGGQTFDEIVAAQNLAASGAASLLPQPGLQGSGTGITWAPGYGPPAPVDEFGVPRFTSGGVMPWTGLAHLEKGETVSRPGEGGGITVNVNVRGSVVGIADLQEQIRSAVRDGVLSGGFRGVFRS